VHQGTLKPGQQLFVGDSKRPIKIAHIYRMQGKDPAEMTVAIPGDICAATKVEELHFDAVLHDSHDEDHHHLKSVNFPPAMLGRAIEPARRGDEQRLADALHKVLTEDPCIRIEHRPNPAETVLYGMGELHLRVLLERMQERFNVQFNTHPPAIPYRETITKTAEARHRHKKQTGGAGQFGEVSLRVEPLARGGGFEFVDDIVGGVIPNQYIPAVEKGVRLALAEGAVAGYPIQDVRVTVFDGKHHAVDSKEVAFVTAGRKAFITAVQEAGATVLEPVVKVEVVVPATSMGDITADLMSRRGRVTGNMTLPAGRVAVTALVPLSEIAEYQARLESMTGGDGSYTLDLSHYDPVPPRKQQELAAAWKPHVTED
jgi:elongation factor G